MHFLLTSSLLNTPELKVEQVLCTFLLTSSLLNTPELEVEQVLCTSY